MVSVREGMRFGRWQVLSDTIERRKAQCRCDCGREYLINTWTLRTGKTVQCRVCTYAAQIKPPQKSRYGQWTVIGDAFTKNGYTHVPVRCDCGTTQTVIKDGLVRGRSTQCRACAGAEPYKTETERSIAETLIAARYRCTNPKDKRFKDYGKRGITFEFTSIREGVIYVLSALGPRPEGMSLDRINNNVGYRPGNLRWATRSDQQRNSRPRSKHLRPKVRARHKAYKAILRDVIRVDRPHPDDAP